MNRRDFVLRTAAAAAGVAIARDFSFAYAQDHVVIDRGWAKVSQLVDGIWVTIADFSKGSQAMSNGGVLAGKTAALLFEGHLQPEAAALEIEVAKQATKAPIRGAVNSHYHFDHTFGNEAYARQSIPIIAHPAAAKLMQERYVAMKGKGASIPAGIEQQIAAAKTDLEREHLKTDLGLAQMMGASIDGTNITLPTESVTSQRIDLGGLTAVIEPRPGHTITDIIVRVPERDVIFTGDLLHALYPVTFDANMTAWRNVLDEFMKEAASTRFVPGHGPVWGVKDVRQFADIFDDLRAYSEKMMKAGVPVQEAQHRYVVPAQFKDWLILSWGFTIGAAVTKYYQELK